jgi:ketosteroid isomerase-like protein
VSEDLAYIVGYEHTMASVGGAEPEAYDLRVTTIFRREHGQWKIVHRHADPMPGSDTARRQMTRF